MYEISNEKVRIIGKSKNDNDTKKKEKKEKEKEKQGRRKERLTIYPITSPNQNLTSSSTHFK